MAARDEFFVDGRRFIPASRAAKEVGFVRDYVARLCRQGTVHGQLVGSNWYVDDQSLDQFLKGREERTKRRNEELRHAFATAPHPDASLDRSEQSPRADSTSRQPHALTTAPASLLAHAHKKRSNDRLMRALARGSLLILSVALIVGTYAITNPGSAQAALRSFELRGHTIADSAARAFAEASTPASNPGALSASAASGAANFLRSLASWLDPINLGSPSLTYVRANPIPTASSSPSVAPTTTIVYRTITEPVIERVVRTPAVAISEQLSDATFVTQDEFQSGLSALGNALSKTIDSSTAANSNAIVGAYQAASYAAPAASDNDSTFTGGSITSLAVTGSATSSFGGGIALTGGCVSVNGTCITGGGGGGASLSAANTWTALQLFAANASSSNFSNFGKAYFGGTATTTIDNAGNVVVGGSLTANGNVALGNATSTNLFASVAHFASAMIDSIASLTATNLVATNATTTNLALTGVGANELLSTNGNGSIVATSTPTAASFNATSTTATSTFAGGVSAAALNVTNSTATSTFANGIALFGGCVTVNGTCLGATSASSTLLSDNNTWSGNALFSASTTFAKLVNLADASSTLNTFGMVWLPNVTAGSLLYANSAGQVAAASATYPVQFSGGAVSLAFGTTTANTFSQLQTLNAGLTASASSTIGNGTQAGGLTISGGATTTGQLVLSGATTTAVRGIVAPCFSNDGVTCVTGTGGSGGITSITAGTGLTGGTITTSGTIALDLTHANSWTGLQQFANASSTLFSAYGPAYFGGTATSSFSSTGQLTLANLASAVLGVNSAGQVVATSTIGTNLLTGTLPVTIGGTGSTTLTGILKGNGTNGIQTAIGGTDYEFPLTFSTGLSRSGNTITNTGVLSLGNYATTTGSAISLSTSTLSFNGLTLGQTVVASANGILFTPTVSGTLTNAGLTNSTVSGIALGGTLASLSHDSTLNGTSYNGSAAVSNWSLNLSNANSWTGLQQFTNASSSIFSVYGPAYFGATATSTFNSAGQLTLNTTNTAANRFLYTGTNGLVIGVASSSLDLPNAALQNSTISGVSLGGTLANLSATNGTLTFSGSYNGSSAQTVGLNLTNGNSWTGLQQFQGASTTLFSAYGPAYFGGSATSSFSTAGALTLASALTVPNGGTGWANVQSGALLYGNGSSALATTSAGTAGQVLALLNGVPTWTATTTISSYTSVKIYGAIGDGVADDTTAVQNAINAKCAAGGGGIFFPDGVYRVTNTITITCGNVALEGSSASSTISYTGSSAVPIILASSTPTFLYNVRIANLTVTGNSHSTYALETNAVHHSQFENLRLRNVTQAGLFSQFGVLNTYTDISVSSNEAPFTTQPVNGILFSTDGVNGGVYASVITDPIIEGVSGFGIQIDTSNQNVFVGGSSESNFGGINVATTSVNNTFSNIDLESNTQDAFVAGNSTRFENISSNSLGGSSFHISGGALDTQLIGGDYDQITIDPTASDTYIENVAYGRYGGTLTDNGYLTTIINSTDEHTYKNAFQNNVGIGTTTPDTSLEIFYSGTANGSLANLLTIDSGTLSANAAGSGSLINFRTNSMTQYFGAVGGYSNGSGTGGMGIWSGTHTGSPNLYVNSSGYVGVATTSPATTLSVGGSGYITGGFGVGVENTTAGTLQTSGNATIGGTLILDNPAANSLLYTDSFNQVAAVTISNPFSLSSGTLGLNTDSTLHLTGANLGINLANQNLWTALQQFSAASSTILSVYNGAFFGVSATSSFNSSGQLALVSNGLTVGTNQLVVSGDNVGIGTTTPGDNYDGKTAKFELNGAAEMQGGWNSYDSNIGGLFAPLAGVAAANVIHYGGPGNDVGLVLDNYGGNGTAGSPGIYFIYSTTTAGNISYTSSAVSYNTTSDRRIKENIATTTAGLATLMQIPVDNFDFISDPTHTVQQGFIAQSLLPIYPEAVTTNGDNGIVPLGPTSTPWSVDYGRITPLIVQAVQDIANISSTFEQNLIAWLGNAQNGIDQFFANVGNFHTVNAQTVCVTNGPTDPSPLCVTKAQLAALLSQTASAQTPESVTSSTSNTSDSTVQNPSSTSPISVSSATSSADSSANPPVIQINGDNPATIQIGDTYNDLGAAITGPQQDLNLGIQTYLNGVPISPVQIDTSAAATDTIDYVVTDQNGLTSTSTRTVIIEAPSISPSDDASTTAATTTDATTTAQ